MTTASAQSSVHNGKNAAAAETTLGGCGSVRGASGGGQGANPAAIDLNNNTGSQPEGYLSTRQAENINDSRRGAADLNPPSDQGHNPALPPLSPVAPALQLLTPEQVAELLACSDCQVLRLIKKRQLAATIISTNSRSHKPLYRIRPADLAEFINRRMVQPALPPAAKKRRPRKPTYERIV